MQSYSIFNALWNTIPKITRQFVVRFGILFVLVLFMVPVTTFAQSCNESVTAANTLLESAKTLMLAGDSETAIAQVTAAQALLVSCNDVESVTTPQALASATPVPAPIDPTPVDLAPETTDTVSMPTGFVVQAPVVDQEQGVTFIAFAHTSVDSGAIDLYLDSIEVPVISQLAYGEVTPLIPFNIGSRRFNVRPAGSGMAGEVLYTVEWNYVGNSSWIVTAAGFLNEFAFIVEPISIVRNDYDGNARVRVVNLVRDTRISVQDEAGTVFGDGLGWIGIKDSMIAPGTYPLNINLGDGQTMGEPTTFDFLAETTYTLYVIGQPNRDFPITFLTVVAPQDMTRVRFVNASGATVDIHYRPSNDRLVESIAAGETSPYITLASGAVTFLAYLPGTGPTGQEQGGVSLQLRPGRDVTITLNNGSMVVSEVTLP